MNHTIDGFEDLLWLFTCDNRNRGKVRMNFDEAGLLWKASKITQGNILEVGRDHGGSTTIIAAASYPRHIYSIDINPTPMPECEAFLRSEKHQSRIDLLVADSREPLPDKEYGMLFIDGDHSYEGVLADIKAHWNALKHSSDAPLLAVFHDAVPNDGLYWRDAAHPIKMKFREIKNRFRSPERRKPKYALNYCKGVHKVCQMLIDSGYAKEWSKAGSVLVLEKIKDVPSTLGE